MQLVIPTASESPCASCVTLYGRSCCQLRPGDGVRFPMTFMEAQRLARLYGIKLNQAVERLKAEASPLQSFGDDFASLIVNGWGLYLPLDDAGYCIYLKGGKCHCQSVKPHICAMFPFKKMAGHWTIGRLVGGAGLCYGQDVSGLDLSTALQLFKTNVVTLDAIYDQWQNDLKVHAIQMRKLWKPLRR